MNGQNVTNNGQCLADETLTDYLEGNLEPVVRAASEVHLIGCDGCRANLALYMRILRTGTNPEEDAALTLIEEKVGNRNLRPGSERRNTINHFKGWFFSLAAVAALLLVGVVSGWFLRGHSGDDMNRRILSETRPFEARLTAQTHIPITRSLEDGNSRFNFELLGEEMARSSPSAYETGLFHLIQKDLASAIYYLEKAAAEPDASAGVHNDLGVAYLEQPNLMKAADQFRAALQKAPDFAPTVFNQSILYEKMGDISRAQMRWQEYLQLDPDSEWSVEARTKLRWMSR